MYQHQKERKQMALNLWLQKFTIFTNDDEMMYVSTWDCKRYSIIKAQSNTSHALKESTFLLGKNDQKFI